MCAKLKCCLNYEVDDYMEASRKMPSKEITLFTQDNEYFLFKTDILAGLITYSTQKGVAANLETISYERAKEVIELNKRGEKPESLAVNGNVCESERPIDLLADADISRFDKSKKKKNKNRKDNRQKDKQNQNKPQAKQEQQQKQPQQGQQKQQKQRGPKRHNRQDAPKQTAENKPQATENKESKE